MFVVVTLCGAARDCRAEKGEAAHSGSAEPTLAWKRTQPWYRHWERQHPRWFLSGDVSLGFTQSLRTTVGYGQPFWRFIGIDAQALSSLEFGAVAIGPRIDALFINGLLDVRSTWSYSRRQPLPAESYATFDGATGPLARYMALEGALWSYLPLGPTLAYAELNGLCVWGKGVPTSAVFEEYYRATLNANTALFARAMWSMRLLRESLRFGPASDLVLTPGRTPVVRVGGFVAQQFTPHLALTVLLTLPVATPDELPVFTQSWGIARVTYSFATGEEATSH